MKLPVELWRGPIGRHSQTGEYIDANNILEVEKWCCAYANDLPSKDTGKSLIRWNIAMYQLAYVYDIIENKIKHDRQDMAEALGSCQIHAMISARFANIELRYEFMPNECYSSFDINMLGSLLGNMQHVTRQFLYLYLRRKNRYDKNICASKLFECISELVILNKTYNNKGIQIAMQKLNDVELEGH